MSPVAGCGADRQLMQGKDQMGANELGAGGSDLLRTAGLAVTFAGRMPVPAVRGVDLVILPRQVVGLVGESGSGKSALARAILGLHGPHVQVSGEVNFREENLLTLSPAQRRTVLGRRISFIPQDPSSSLNPLRRVGSQIREAITNHEKVTRHAASDKVRRLLQLVGFPSPGGLVGCYPHQLSGGMKQRVVIAMAVACDPDLIVADEPTTALDVTVQAHILGLLARLRDELGTAILLITHNLSVVSGFADRVEVMYAGRIVESMPVAALAAADTLHPYSEGLLRCVPYLDDPVRDVFASIPGSPPDPTAAEAGCSFAARCDLAVAECGITRPPLREREPGHSLACHVRGMTYQAART
jgi:oligopeptide/dipeptide ABC transporter ATP-binding protein